MKSIWIARNEDGILLVFDKKPTRAFDKERGKGLLDVLESYRWLFQCKQIPGTWFYPEVTWENSPIELVVKENFVKIAISRLSKQKALVFTNLILKLLVIVNIS